MIKFFSCIVIIVASFSTGNAQKIFSGDLNIITNEVTVLREKCLNNTFSFCSDGFEQPYRLFSYFISMDTLTNNLKKKYSKGVFMFVPPSETDSLLKKGVHFKNYWELDSLFLKNNNLDNTVSFYNKYLKKKVKSYYKKNNILKKFDGQLMFESYKIKMSYFYAGKRKITIPNINKKRNSSLIEDIDIDVYYILNIQEAMPYIPNSTKNK